MKAEKMIKEHGGLSERACELSKELDGIQAEIRALEEKAEAVKKELIDELVRGWGHHA